MINRCVDPFTQPVLIESFGIQFPAQVTVNIIENHEKEKKQEMKFMYGDGENKYDKHTGFQNSFQRMKSISGKRAWIDRLVMGNMDPFEQRRVMYQPVHPVKISVVQQSHYWKSKKEIPFAVLIDILVVGSMLCNSRDT